VLDDRVFKVIGWLDGEPVGIALVTNHLDLVPQISPPFLYRRYPELADRNAIYFGIFVCVDATVRAKSVTPRLIAGMAQVAALRGGAVICDISQHNSDRGVGRMVGRVTDWFPNSSFGLIDSQHSEAICPALGTCRTRYADANCARPAWEVGCVDGDRDQSVPTAEG
jgi:hypothetical protein